MRTLKNLVHFRKITVGFDISRDDEEDSLCTVSAIKDLS